MLLFVGCRWCACVAFFRNICVFVRVYIFVVCDIYYVRCVLLLFVVVCFSLCCFGVRLFVVCCLCVGVLLCLLRFVWCVCLAFRLLLYYPCFAWLFVCCVVVGLLFAGLVCVYC